jgi:hypothetical protein
VATATPAQPNIPQRGLKAVLARHPLVSFFVMAYAFTWLVWLPWVLGEDGAGLLPINVSQTASGYLNATAILAGPTLAAFIMTATTEGREGVRRLLGRLVLWRVGIRWYLFALIGVPLIIDRLRGGGSRAYCPDERPPGLRTAGRGAILTSCEMR